MTDNNLPIVALVGRPNVGKSTLFNRLLGKKLAITDDEAGTTRDRHYETADWNGLHFNLVDTGGIEGLRSGKFATPIMLQVELAIREAALILFMVDAQTGVADPDLKIARLLRPYGAKTIVVANKADTPTQENELQDFRRLGLGPAVPVSALHGRSTGDLLDLFTSRLTPAAESGPAARGTVIKLAIVGRPNVGKSTLANCLIGEDRMLTDSNPGTTRDSVDTLIREGEQWFSLIDTAGMRKRSHVREAVERASNLHALKSIERCDVALLLLDAHEGPGEQDLLIMKEIIGLGRGLFVGLNKWDLVSKSTKTFDAMVADMRESATQLDNIPFFPLSAISGQRSSRVFEIASAIYGRLNRQVPTQDLNAFLESATTRHQHPAVGGRQIRFYGINQTHSHPVIFEVKSNDPEKVTVSYGRYLANRFNERFDFEGVPIKFRFSKKKR